VVSRLKSPKERGAGLLTQSNLSKNDYFKVLKFVDKTHSLNLEEFRYLVLKYLADMFNYQLTTFWLANDNGDMVNPITLSVNWRIMDKFMDQYYKVDPFYPKNLPGSLLNKNLITVDDLIVYEDYQKNPYFKEVLDPHNLPHKLMYIYRNNDKEILGVSTFLRPENSKGFNSRDYSLIETVLKYVSRSLTNILLQDDLNFQKGLFESLSNHSDNGLFIIDNNFKIIYSNSASIEYSRDLLKGSSVGNPVNNFVKEFLRKNHMSRHGSTKTLYSDKNKPFSVRIVPQVQGVDKPYYFIFIQPVNDIKSSQQNGDHELLENLTVREREVLMQLLKGQTNKEIAESLFISLATVKAHLQSIFGKCDVSNRASLIYKFKDIIS